MTRVFKPLNRLEAFVSDRHGVEASLLIVAAEERTRKLEGGLRDHVAQQIERILAAQRLGGAALRLSSDDLGEAAIKIAEIAGTANLPAVGQVARGIRAMIEHLQSSGAWHAEALTVHINALALVGGPSPPPPAASDKIVAQLRSMRAAIGVSD